MGRDTDDDAWRAIVENYGDRIELDDDPPLDVLHDDLEREHLDHEVAEVRHDRRHTDKPRAEDDDGYVPPPPPPLPSVARDRLLAWLGLFGAPTILLVTLVLGISLPPFIGYLLVAAFIGGFGYLVVKMPRGPADPWDDGARL